MTIQGQARMAITNLIERRADVPDETVVVLPSELDMASVDDLRAAVAMAFGDPDERGAVVLDCSRLTFVDASGIGTLVWTANLGKAAQREVRLRDPGKTLRALLAHTRIERRFPVITLEDGHESLSTGAMIG